MSLAAEIVPSGEVHREDGPAMCAAAHEKNVKLLKRTPRALGPLFPLVPHARTGTRTSTTYHPLSHTPDRALRFIPATCG